MTVLEQQGGLKHSCVAAADLGEDAGGGGHSAVHHAVEDGEQAVQREGLGPQEVVTGLSREQVTFQIKGPSTKHGSGASLSLSPYLFIFLQEVGFLDFPVVLWGQKPRLFNPRESRGVSDTPPPRRVPAP